MIDFKGEANGLSAVILSVFREPGFNDLMAAPPIYNQPLDAKRRSGVSAQQKIRAGNPALEQAIFRFKPGAIKL
jgi:hypothetical protein